MEGGCHLVVVAGGKKRGGVPTSALAPRAHLVHGDVTQEGRVGDVEPGRGFGHVVVDGHESNLERVARTRVRVARGGGRHRDVVVVVDVDPDPGRFEGPIPKVTRTSRDPDTVSRVRRRSRSAPGGGARRRERPRVWRRARWWRANWSRDAREWNVRPIRRDEDSNIKIHIRFPPPPSYLPIIPP